jgi:hypothetical protein
MPLCLTPVNLLAGSAYSLRKYDRREVSSGGVFWRLRLLRDRTVCNFKNGVHDVGVQLWSGELRKLLSWPLVKCAISHVFAIWDAFEALVLHLW